MAKQLVLVTLMASVLTSCSRIKPDFDWLMGSWERSNGKPNTQTIETWDKINDTNYVGISLVLIGQDTNYREDCIISKEGNDYYYIADVPENIRPTKFKIIEFSKQGFKAINYKHDFPQEIIYKLKGNDLTASISGEDKTIIYEFIRL